tara:strand:+ start:550 stop:1569 length:1020 start_codon:yes stop_codon:yes gene_type:complete
MNSIKKIFDKLLQKKNLDVYESEELFEVIIEKKLNSVEISSILSLLASKKETFDEIYGALLVLKNKAKRIKLPSGLIDTCGTGGDNKGSFNISTATAILSSACGLKVAKHGNKSITSKSGSSDILLALGINIDTSEKEILNIYKQCNICFLFAPNFHPALRNVSEIRQTLPFKTIFNLLGPLLNPSKLSFQLLGVGERNNLYTHSKCLAKYGLKSAWVVNNDNGYDELTTTSSNTIIKVKNKKTSNPIKLLPQDLDFDVCNQEEICGGSPEENAYLMHRLFDGETGAIRDNVLLNTAACLMISEKVKNWREGIDLATKNIDNFSAKKKLEHIISITKNE